MIREVIVGTEDRPARCSHGHQHVVTLTLTWNPWGAPDGWLDAPVRCPECGERLAPLGRDEAVAETTLDR